jgi:DNA (cytosine-5)-methyltransferase 1
MLRVISEVKPTYVVGENVRGLTNWNGGVVFEEVCTDLESQGYTVQPILLPACAVGAPHRRDRIWFVAANTNNARDTSLQCGLNEYEQKKSIQWEYPQSKSCGSRDKRTTSNSDSIRQHECECDNEEQPSERGEYALNDTNENDGQGNATNTNSSDNKTWTQREVLEQSNREASNGFINVECRNQWQNFPTQSPICGGDDGLSTKLDGITFSKWRNESIKGYGNAIVPQVAYEIFKVIAEMDAREKAQLKLF